MTTPKYSDELVNITEETFNRLASLYDVLPTYQDLYGLQLFDFNPDRLRALEGRELLEMAVLTIDGCLSFPNYFKEEQWDERVVPQVFEILIEKGIDGKKFQKEMYGFKSDRSGEHLGPIIGCLTRDLKEGKLNSFKVYSLRNMPSNNSSETRFINGINKQKNPFSLEHVIDIENSPVTITHDSVGMLYVLDSLGVLYGIKDGVIENKWNDLDIDYRIIKGLGMRVGIHRNHSIQPTIAVKDNMLYVATAMNIGRYDLSEQGSKDRAKRKETTDDTEGLISLKGVLGKAEDTSRLIQGVYVDGDNVLVNIIQYQRSNDSEISRTGGDKANSVHFIGQFIDGEIKPIHSGRYILDEESRCIASEDLTMRLNIFKGGLYMPTLEGFGLYTEDGVIEMGDELIKSDRKVPTALERESLKESWADFMKGPITDEMVDEYYEEEYSSDRGSAITKFSFGDDFFVGVKMFWQEQSKMICIMKPVYDSDQEGLVKSGEPVMPETFEVVHVSLIPYKTALMNKCMAVSAHGNGYAITDPSFKKVLIYQKTQTAE
jgi:hypothetical protein